MNGSIPAHKLAYESRRSLDRIFARLDEYRKCFSDPSELDESCRNEFDERLRANWEELFGSLYKLYGFRYDFFFHLEQIVLSAFSSYSSRSEEMRQLDIERNHDPLWYRRQTMLGGALYVDLFSEDLQGLVQRIPYLKEMGFTYVHLMPLFKTPNGENDGGYAVSDYRNVDEKLGTIQDLKDLAAAFRKEGISLVVDFVFNHTSDDHEWARRAQSGEAEYEDYYYVFPSREMPDRYDRTLREIFPTVRRGSFSWHDGMRRWVWTSFNDYQWDLKYANPDVFRGMMQEMLFLSNLGVEILRLDAVAFIWKQEGTNSENLPEAHELIRTFNTIARIAAPSLLFKSEAIVHPDDVLKYIDAKECQLSYNPLLMATLWESIATRDTSLLRKSIEHRHDLPEFCTWCNYIRGHDDIGWTFDDADGASVGINGYDHRQFLNQFYTGQFEGSFAKGVPFQFNPATGDMRVSGTLASLAGVEQALEMKDETLLKNAIERICVMHSVIFSIGGIPLIYLGDEWGALNDYSYEHEPRKQFDSRWVHRVKFDWPGVDNGRGWHACSLEIHNRVLQLIRARKEVKAFAGVEMELLDLGSTETLAYVREHSGDRVIVVQNLTDRKVVLEGSRIIQRGPGHYYKDLITGTEVSISSEFTLDPYEHFWLRRM